MLSRRLNGDDQASETANRDRRHHCGEPGTLLAGITDPANPRTPPADDGSGRVGDQPSDIAAQLGHRDGGALAFLKIYVHPLAEGLPAARRRSALGVFAGR
jgi:hypothetical protein